MPLAILLLALGGVVGLYFRPLGLRRAMAALGLEPGAGSDNPFAVPPPAAAPAAPTRPTVAGLGRLLPAGDVTVVAQPFGSGDARVASLAVAAGDRVNQGQVLAVLDNEPTLLATLESSRAAVAAQDAVLARTRASVMASADEARAELRRAEAAAANAQSEFARVEALFARGVAPQVDLDDRRTV